MRRHMVQKSDALFSLIRACYIYWSKLHTSLLSITTKPITLFTKRTIVIFSSASIYTSDIRKSSGDKKRNLPSESKSELQSNENCAISVVIPSRDFFFARRYNLVLLSMFTLI